MRKACIRDLRIHASELVRDSEAGETIVIERRGEPGVHQIDLAYPATGASFGTGRCLPRQFWTFSCAADM
jgi:antitoxin (DNA-binding transcriptional repressor) of toxin-antitoxin stability system